MKTPEQAKLAAIEYSKQLVVKLTELEAIGPFESRRAEGIFRVAIELHFIDGFNFGRDGVA